MTKLFTSPELLRVRIWRYMRPEHFKFLVEESALWFSSADSFPDQWEGSYTLRKVQRRETLWDSIDNPAEFRNCVRENADWNRQATFVNCWSLNENECSLMWEAYVAGKGIAVQSTVGRLLKALPDWVLLTPVLYIDHDSTDISEEHSLDPFGWKQRAYSSEREWRLIIDQFPLGDPQRCLPIEPNGHRQVQVELDTLIESVIIGPKLNETAMRSVRLLLTRKGLDKPVLTSKLSRLPYH